MPIKAPKGTRDILPEDIYQWNFVEEKFANLCKRFGYKEIRIPVFEHTELFQRGVGDTTDIVQKEMYTFLDKGGRSISLRPEGTAGVVRSFIEHGMSSLPQPVKLFYQITAYRYENVQKGRYREFNQFGAELLGASDPAADVEIITLLALFFQDLGIKNLELNLNSIGCPKCRGEYNKKLRAYLESKIEGMCDTCKDRFHRNPLRILDCKEETCKSIVKDAPALLDNICDECRDHFKKVTDKLNAIGIIYNIDKGIVRGLDYYTKTVFEFVSRNIGSQGTVCGGGRYDGLVEECGGPPTPGIGFALGVERLLLEMQNQGIEIPKPEAPDIYIGAIGEKAELVSERLAWQLRQHNITCIKDIMGRSVKAQMKYADKIGANYVLILGDDEIETNKAKLKDMRTGDTKDITLDTLIDRLIKNKA
ncbi:MAG: histidine--tRNA ligase [Clostridiaceae bacterium]|nr:histidine--tRNA ligase [Clostridiaceae bacterium]